jgi:WD40 repeat protein
VKIFCLKFIYFVKFKDSEVELMFHNGTVRDLIFMQSDQNNHLVSGGAGDCKLYVTDCNTQQPIRVYTGHEGHIYSLCTWATTSTVFISGSQDKTCKFWDLRSPEAIQTINCNPASTTQGINT